MLVIFLLMFKSQRHLNMDNKKQELKDMLEKLSEDELSTLGDLISKASNKPRNRRRGRGKRKQKKNTVPAKQNSSDKLNDLQLNTDEQAEMDMASKFDKEKGLDKPKSHGIILPARQFQKVSIQCMDCRKTFEISPSLIPIEKNRYKCNSCICRGRDRP